MQTPDKLKKLEDEKAKQIAQIEAEFADKIKVAKLHDEAIQELKKLAEKFEYKNIKAFLTALEFIKVEVPVTSGVSAYTPKTSVSIEKKKENGKVTEEVKAKVIHLFKVEHKKASEVAEAVGLSVGSVNKIKADAHLTNPKVKSAVKTEEPLIP